MIATAFLRNVHHADDNSSFVRWDRLFFRIMKPICAARTANVKVNEGFWSIRAREREHIYSANFTVKFPLCRKREMETGRITTDMSVVSVICSTARLFVWFIVTLSPLFRHYLTWEPLSTRSESLRLVPYISSFPLLERAICHSRYLYGRTKSFQIFNCGFKTEETCDPLDLSISVYRNDLYFTLYLSRCPFPIDSPVPLTAVFLSGYTYKAVRPLVAV